MFPRREVLPHLIISAELDIATVSVSRGNRTLRYRCLSPHRICSPSPLHLRTALGQGRLRLPDPKTRSLCYLNLYKSSFTAILSAQETGRRGDGTGQLLGFYAGGQVSLRSPEHQYGAALPSVSGVLIMDVVIMSVSPSSL